MTLKSQPRPCPCGCPDPGQSLGHCGSPQTVSPVESGAGHRWTLPTEPSPTAIPAERHRALWDPVLVSALLLGVDILSRPRQL